MQQSRLRFTISWVLEGENLMLVLTTIGLVLWYFYADDSWAITFALLFLYVCVTRFIDDYRYWFSETPQQSLKHIDFDNEDT